MTRRLLLAGVVAFAGLMLPAAAGAHPLGNFSVNHLDVVAVSRDRVEVRYVLDQAEIPTFQERDLTSAVVLGRKRAEVARGLALWIDGSPVPLSMAPGGRLEHRPGQGGLPTTRVELLLAAPAAGARRVELADRTFPGRIGWHAVVPIAGRGTAVRASVPVADPTRRLTTYPRDLLSSPERIRSAALAVTPGRGTVTGPRGRAAAAGATTTDRSGGTGGFAALLGDGAGGRGVLLLLLVTAFGWGAVHALSPGHGKTMVAAYLVGTRGGPRAAVALGVTVTATHTAGVFALGLVTLSLSAYVLPEQLYPWLNLAAGLMVLVVGLAVARSRAAAARRPARDHHAHGHRPHGHEHGHHHGGGDDHGLGRRGLLVMGASAGLVPCPSAIVVLLGAIAQHEVALGLLLITAFSAGLATTLTVLGILVTRLVRLPAPGRAAAVLPVASAILIVAVGLVLTVKAVPGVLG